jgi:hypothetical protein
MKIVNAPNLYKFAIPFFTVRDDGSAEKGGAEVAAGSK